MQTGQFTQSLHPMMHYLSYDTSEHKKSSERFLLRTDNVTKPIRCLKCHKRIKTKLTVVQRTIQLYTKQAAPPCFLRPPN